MVNNLGIIDLQHGTNKIIMQSTSEVLEILKVSGGFKLIYRASKFEPPENVRTFYVWHSNVCTAYDDTNYKYIGSVVQKGAVYFVLELL